MKFIQFTDTHLRKDYQTSNMGQIFQALPDPGANIKKVLRDTDWKDMDFVVITGDMVHDGEAEDYSYLKEILDSEIPENVKRLYVLGNHDHKEAFYEGIAHKKCSESYYYVQNHDGWRIIVLDSAVPGKESGTISPQQLQWLKEVLKDKAPKGSLLFLHHPVFWNTPSIAPMALTNGEDVMDILWDSDVAAIFCGHTHTNSVQLSRGILQYTCDSSAFSIATTKDGILQFTDKTGFFVVNMGDSSDTVTVHSEIIGDQRAALSIPLATFAKQMAALDGANA